MVYAKDIDDKVFDENGERLVLDEEVSGETVMQRKDGASLYSNVINCEYYLRVYNDYTYVVAYSGVSGDVMDRICTICRAYYEKGSLIDEAVNELSGKVGACSATIKVPANPFNFKVGSAFSTHSFSKTGYVPVQKSLSWYKK